MSLETQSPERMAQTSCLVAAGVLILSALFSPIPASAQMVLDPGQSHIVTPSQTECLRIEDISPAKGTWATVEADCDTATGILDVSTSLAGNGTAVETLASSVFRFPFRVEDVGGAIGPSNVPIHVVVPTEWAARLLNDHAFQFQGHASIDIFLQLLQDADPVPGGYRGRVIERTTILGATHGGVAGCLAIPTDPAGAISMAISCALTLSQRLRGKTLATLNAVVEAGRTYSIELQLVARVRNNGTPVYVAEASTYVAAPSAPGLKWEQMVITVGTDPAVLVADLQKQIDKLREDLENHTHNFLTGQGTGHNNVLAVSSPSIIPGDTADGKTIEELQSGPVTGPPVEKPGRRLQLGHRRP